MSKQLFTIHPESPNKVAIPLVEAVFGEIEARLRGLLPELPHDLTLYVHGENNIPETGSGGFAYSPTMLSLSVDNDFENKKLQKKSLIGAIYHECFHIVQGHTWQEPRAEYESALDSAIYEGCATAFEREYSGAKPRWGDYSMHSERELNEWRDALAGISIDEWLADDGKLWRKWSFYDPEDDQRWRTYKVGTWMVDTYLERTGKDIRDLRRMLAREIREELI